MPPELTDDELVIAYHERTKHHYHRYAASLGYLDWDTQPDPFRRFAGADLLPLPLPPTGRALAYDALYDPAAITPEPLVVASLSLFLRYALSITAWKQSGSSRWAVRANPSSGNLHPTEGYLVLPALDAPCDRPAVHHYAPREHALERRLALTDAQATALSRALGGQAFLVGLSSIPWREAWKYGERAFRYCQHDVGHALGALRYAAAALGWSLTLLDGMSDPAIAALLGLDRDADFGPAERELPELLALVRTTATRASEPPAPPDPAALEQLASALAGAAWCGKANVLSAEHVMDWDVIDEVAARSAKRSLTRPALDLARQPDDRALLVEPWPRSPCSAEAVIVGRRSAVKMDAKTSLARDVLYRMLARLVPPRGAGRAPLDALAWPPHIHLGLLVHRVDGLAPGRYALVRDPAKVALVRAQMDPRFVWQKPEGCPAGLDLYLLAEGDCRSVASSVSCMQDIAADGAFAVAMLAELPAGVLQHGAWFYRRLFWEAGLIGQVLYLEAEAALVRSTGIGCYFDDPAAAAFGIQGRELQSFYHFTVGGALHDPRVLVNPGYER